MNYLSFKEIVDKNGLENKTTSEIKRKEKLNELKRHIHCVVYMRDHVSLLILA